MAYQPLFNAKYSLYIYIKYDLVWFDGISNIVGFLKLNPVYMSMLDI